MEDRGSQATVEVRFSEAPGVTLLDNVTLGAILLDNEQTKPGPGIWKVSRIVAPGLGLADLSESYPRIEPLLPKKEPAPPR